MNCNSQLEELGCPHPDSLTRSPAGHRIEPGLDNLRRHLSIGGPNRRRKRYQAPKPSAAARLAGNCTALGSTEIHQHQFQPTYVFFSKLCLKFKVFGLSCFSFNQHDASTAFRTVLATQLPSGSCSGATTLAPSILAVLTGWPTGHEHAGFE